MAIGLVVDMAADFQRLGGWGSVESDHRDHFRDLVLEALVCATPKQKRTIVLEMRDLGALYSHLPHQPIDLSGAVLAHADLRGTSLSRVSLRGSDLRMADLSSADLDYADLREILGTRLILRYATAVAADLSRSILIAADLTGANMKGASFDEAEIIDTIFDGTVLLGADIVHESWSGGPRTLRGVTTRERYITRRDGITRDAACPHDKDWKPSGLHRILRDHESWLNGDSRNIDDTRRAVLCNADLSWHELVDVRLDFANLRSVNFRYAILSRSSLASADLVGANFDHATLNDIILHKADLYGASFLAADLSGANLAGAVLTSAVFRDANLTTAKLMTSTLSGADITAADVSDTKFTPIETPFSPNLVGLVDVRFMYGMQSGLSDLRESLKRAGDHDRARQVTYAIQTNRTRHLRDDQRVSKKLEGIGFWILFGLTTRWGQTPFRALQLGLFVNLLSAVFYYVFIVRCIASRQFRTAIWVLAEDGCTRLIASPVASIRLSLQFCLMTIFDVRLGEMKLASIARRLFPRVPDLHGRGWIRPVAFIQWIISLYLVSIWGYTVGGKPFWVG